MTPLLAVDLGLRTGLAYFDEDGGLVWYRSQHFGTRDSLRRGVHGVLESLEGLRTLVVEGGGPIATIWIKEADRRGVAVRQISAEDWRATLLPRAEAAGRDRAKASATRLAHQVIEQSRAPRPTSLRHDAAEAILIGYWAMRQDRRLSRPIGDQPT